MRCPRARHHTEDKHLAGIERDCEINPGRGLTDDQPGVHVEIEPFGTTRPNKNGSSSPKADLGIEKDGAFVEFDLPGDRKIVQYSCGIRRTAIVLTKQPLALAGLHPEYVRVRRHFWELWRRRPE
jgi:hypothetical protein